MAQKGKGSGLGARMAASPANAVAAGFAAATGSELPQAAEPEAPVKGEVVALNIRLPKEMHRTLRRIAFDEETSINALLIQAAERMLAERG
jgi:hypothetical protein